MSAALALLAIYGTFALMIIGFTAPQLFITGARGLTNLVIRGKASLSKLATAKEKAKKLAPYMNLAHRVEQITPGQILKYKIERKKWGGDYVTVKLDTQCLQTEKRYILSIENTSLSIPGQETAVMYTTDKAIIIAASIMDRNGELVSMPREVPASVENISADVKKGIIV